MIPYLGANCPACGSYNGAADTICWSCRRPMAHGGAQPRRRYTLRRALGLVLAVPLTIATVGYVSDVFIPGQPASLELVPDFVKVAPSEATTFRATVHDARGHSITPELTWSSDGGIIQADGTLTVPARSGSYRVTVTTPNGLSAIANVLVEPGPASRVSITTSGTTKPSELASLSATVLDAHGNQILPPKVTWSVTPATATIDEEGRFRSRTVGTYAIEARSGDAVGTSAVIVSCPQTHNDVFRGVTFSVVCGVTGDIWIAGTMTSQDTKTILETIERDVVDLEREFALPLNGRFRMYTYSSTDSFDQALTSLFPDVTGDVTGLYVAPDSIVVDWEGANATVPESTVRHELAHLFLERASGRLGGLEIPAWFHEGFATVQEYALAGSEWESIGDRYCAASAAATGTMPSLASMTSSRDFRALSDRTGYIVGAQAVRFMLDDIGVPAIRKMLTSIGIGHHWDDAYREASGRSWDEFVATFPARLRALASRYPGVVFANDTPDGAGVSYILYGYDPAASVRVTIENARFGGSSARPTTSTGCAFGYVDGRWPAGNYSFNASGRAGNVTATLRK